MPYVVKVTYTCHVCQNETVRIKAKPDICQACRNPICKQCKISNFCKPCVSQLSENQKRNIEILHIFVSIFRVLLDLFLKPFFIAGGILIIGIFAGFAEDLWETEPVGLCMTIYLIASCIFLVIRSIEQKLCKKNLPLMKKTPSI